MVLMLAITTVAALMLLPGFASQDEAGVPAAATPVSEATAATEGEEAAPEGAAAGEGSDTPVTGEVPELSEEAGGAAALDGPEGEEVTRAAADEIRFQKQCFLSTNMIDIIEKIHQLNGSPVATLPRRHYAIRGASAADITAKLTNRPGLANILNQGPAFMSFLMPHVKVYKVFDNGSETEFLFDDHLREEDIMMLTENHRGRPGGVGLESFEWDFLGVNPAEVENNIRARMTLRFNNMQDFDKDRKGLRDERPYRFSDLVLPEPMRRRGAFDETFNPRHFRLKVVLGWSLMPSIEAGLEEGNGSHVVSEEVREMISGFQTYDTLRELIEENRKVMYLNLISHDIDFDETGSVSLTAEYQAYVEGIFSSLESDILNISQANQTSLAERSLEDVEGDLRQVRAARSNGGDCVVGAEGAILDQDELEEIHENVANVRQNLAAAYGLLRRRDKAVAYQSILSRLTDGNKIYVASVPMENIWGEIESLDGFLEALSPGNPDPDAVGLRQSIAQARATNPMGDFTITRRIDSPLNLRSGRQVMSGFRRSDDPPPTPLSADRQEANAGSPMTTSQRGSGAAGALTNELANLAGAATAAGQDIDFSGGQEIQFDDSAYEAAIERIKTEINAGASAAGETQNINVEFVLFGDLLDIILDAHNYYGNRQGTILWLEENNIDIYLGTFQYTDHNNPKEQPLDICLADIPISVELFSIWFLETIVEPYKSRMSLRAFIRSVFDKLIINSFGSDCVFDDTGSIVLEQENLSVSPEYYTFPTRKMDQFNLRTFTNENGRTILYDEIGAGFQDAVETLLAYDPTLSFNDYRSVVLYQDRSDNHRVGNISDVNIGDVGYVQQAEIDTQRGIYHLNIGSDKGLLKSISFSRMDQQYLPEARMEQGGDIEHIAQLRERYNATVTMYGNMYYYPGQHIFLNPSVVGVEGESGGQLTVPTQESLTTKLGIGGYFLITKVENVIESGLFETILHCSWVASGFATADDKKPCQAVQLSRDYSPEPPEQPVAEQVLGSANPGVTRVGGENRTTQVAVDESTRTDNYDIF